MPRGKHDMLNLFARVVIIKKNSAVATIQDMTRNYAAIRQVAIKRKLRPFVQTSHRYDPHIWKANPPAELQLTPEGG